MKTDEEQGLVSVGTINMEGAGILPHTFCFARDPREKENLNQISSVDK